MNEQVIQSLISDLALILVLAAFATVLFKRLKQPVVLGYIVAGFIASPHFELFPSVVSHENIEFWAQVGIIVLLFSLGLEFSFKKLLNVGGSAVLTAGIIVLGMMGLGFLVGKLLLGYGVVDGLFLGGMLSMSSTTIIIKALTDLNLRQRKFVPMIFAVLIVEDLFAVVLMVVLSSVAVNKTVEGEQMLESILRLSFFLVLWFVVGILLLPSVFKHYKKLISDETMLIISMGLCFLMAIFSVKSGFSLALGAFVMGSILAGTVEVKRIERLVTPIKDLFGAVFFISVGMMVDPAIIIQYWGTIALLACVVIVGMIVFGTIGMLATGQPLKNAVESGFTLTQIGEFSFIIASLGTSLHVLQASTYPIIVAVSVITTFTTPFFIKKAEPAHKALTHILPKAWTKMLNGYSKSARSGNVSESRSIWNGIVKRFLLRLVLYSVVLIGVDLMCWKYLWPIINKTVNDEWDQLVWTIITFACISPFLYGILTFPINQSERKRLKELSGKVSLVPLSVMMLVALIVCSIYLTFLFKWTYPSHVALIAAVATTIIIFLLLTPLYNKRLRKMEMVFMGNVNSRENHRTGRNNNLVNDLHVAYIVVGYGCKFAGETLQQADLRRKYGVNIVNIERNGVLHPVPGGEMRIYPGDTLGLIGTEEQIERMLPIIEADSTSVTSRTSEAKFAHYQLTDNSRLIGKALKDVRMREDYGTLLVSVQRSDSTSKSEPTYINPTPDLVFQPGDILWVVGDPMIIKTML